MRISRTSRSIILGAITVFICATLYLISTPEDASTPTYVAVAFAGFTNNAQGRALPQFVVSNLSSIRIKCAAMGPMILKTNSMPGKGTSPGWVWDSGWSSCVLEPSEVRLVTAQPPTNEVPWRFGVAAMKPLSLWQTGVEKVGPHLPAAIYSKIRDDRNGQIQVAESREFDPTEIARHHK